MRLIDAGKFLNNLSGMLKSMEDYDAVRKVINNMPTAYDVDKVVEELEKSKEVIATTRYCRKYVNNGKCDEKDCFKCIADYLIDIVKAGVVND